MGATSRPGAVLVTRLAIGKILSPFDLGCMVLASLGVSGMSGGAATGSFIVLMLGSVLASLGVSGMSGGAATGSFIVPLGGSDGIASAVEIFFLNPSSKAAFTASSKASSNPLAFMLLSTIPSSE